MHDADPRVSQAPPKRRITGPRTSYPAAGRQPPRRLSNIAEIAEYLGVGVSHVRRLVLERRIPFIKWGHLLRFDPEDIDAWLDQQRVPPLNRPDDVVHRQQLIERTRALKQRR